MSRRRGPGGQPPVEQDSFLDIVANLVGILIILVVVFGAQIGETLTGRPSDQRLAAEEELLALEETLESLQRQWAQRQAESEDWLRIDQQQERLILQRRLERDLALRQLRSIQAELAQETQRLSQAEQQMLTLKQVRAEQADEIRQLESELQAVRLANLEQEVQTKPEIIEHYPTPIAKTVFGQEVHFQLRDNALVYVPFDELVLRLRNSWEVHAENLPTGHTTTESVGPIADFRLQYELSSHLKSVATPNGMIPRQVVSLTRFWLLPTRPGLGEPLQRLQQADSRFQQTLQRFQPDDTTVSVWVYPESYATFLEVRKLLIARGFRVAIWPLTADQRISGSPEGLRSTAQ